MPRHRIFVTGLAVVLVAAACGGDEGSDPAVAVEDALPAVAAPGAYPQRDASDEAPTAPSEKTTNNVR